MQRAGSMTGVLVAEIRSLCWSVHCERCLALYIRLNNTFKWAVLAFCYVYSLFSSFQGQSTSSSQPLTVSTSTGGGGGGWFGNNGNVDYNNNNNNGGGGGGGGLWGVS